MRSIYISTLLALCLISAVSGLTNSKNPNHTPSPHGLWPMPKNYTFGNQSITIEDPCNFSFEVQSLSKEQQAIFLQYRKYMFSSKCSEFPENANVRTNGDNSFLKINITNPSEIAMNLNTDEFYTLEVEQSTFVLEARSYVGALRGLETFSQLVTLNKETGKYEVVATPVKISDAPKYPHRGFMLDTSRHFITKEKIFKILDGMLYSKQNVFHWHLSDSDGFAFFFPSHPNFTKYGAFSEKEVYSQQDIKDIIKYATARGIRIIPEFDSPAHVGAMAASPEAQPFINCSYGSFDKREKGNPLGQINPIKNESWALLKDVFDDLKEYFPSEFIHLGVDEAVAYCWNNTEILDFIKEHNLTDFHGMMNYYLERLRPLVQDKTRIMWINTATFYLKAQPNEILHWWGDSKGLYNLFKQYPENKVILSNFDQFYLDCGLGNLYGGNAWCSPYHTWRQIYEYKLNATAMKGHEHQILGFESAMWTEMVNDAIVLERVFPRAAVLGEKGWSSDDNAYTSIVEVFIRLNAWVQRAIERGIPSAPLSTSFCEKYPHQCF